MKMYSNPPRKPMMAGGSTMGMSQDVMNRAKQPRTGMGGMSSPQGMMYGGKSAKKEMMYGGMSKKKMQEGGRAISDSDMKTMQEAGRAISDSDMKRVEYDRLMAKKDKTPEERRRMMTIGKELGLVEASATEGRQSLD